MNQKIWKRNFGPAWIHWKYYKHFLFLSLICNLFLLTLSLLSLSLGLSTSIPFCSQDSNSCVLLSRNKVRLLNATQIIHLQIKNEYQYIKIIVSIGVSTPLFLKGKSANCLISQYFFHFFYIFNFFIPGALGRYNKKMLTKG